MNEPGTCPECNGPMNPTQSICRSCGWDSTTAVVRPPRPSLLAVLRGGAWRLVVYGVIAALPFVGFMRLRATGPGPDLATTVRWMVAGCGDRAAELVTIHRAHEIAGAAARLAVDTLNPPSFEGNWAEILAPYATMNVRGWMPLLFYGATTDMAPSSVQEFYEVTAVDGWGTPYRISTRVLTREAGWSEDAEVATDLEAGLSPSFFASPLTELDADRDWMRLDILSAGRDREMDTADDLRLVSYLAVGITIRLSRDHEKLERELEREYTIGRHYFRVEGSRWDLIDARLLAEFRLEYLP